MIPKFASIAGGVMAAVAVSSANAAVDFSATDLHGRSASASFAIVGNDLQVTLTNLGSKPTTSPWDGTWALTGLFFNYNGSGTLSPGSAAVGSGGGVIGTIPSGRTIGSYWAFDTHLTGNTPDGAAFGLHAAGLGLGGGASHGNLGPSAPVIDGLDGAILGWNNVIGANAGVTGKLPLAYSSVVFTLKGAGLTTLSSSDFADVTFQYGTALSDAQLNPTPVPEASTVVAGIGALALMGALRRRQAR